MGDDLDAAMDKALRLLGIREFSVGQMRTRLLAAGFGEEMAERALQKLVAEGWLSDRRFTEAFFRMRLARGDTPFAAAIRARQRGAADAVVEEVRRQFSGEFDTRGACRHLLAKRDPAGARFREPRLWRRHARYLLGKGFDEATVIHALNERAIGEDEGEGS